MGIRFIRTSLIIMDYYYLVAFVIIANLPVVTQVAIGSRCKQKKQSSSNN